MIKPAKSISQAINEFIDSIYLSRSERTVYAYRNALKSYSQVMDEKICSPDITPINQIDDRSIIIFAASLKEYAPATEALYLTAVARFFEFLAAENSAKINLPRVRYLIRQRSRRSGQRLPQFPRDQIEKMVAYAQDIRSHSVETEAQRLRNLRDRSFILVLADTGLRVHEACSLRRGDIDWNEGKAVVTGKGDRQAIVRFSSRSIAAIKEYINARAGLDGSSGRALTSLPIFARHDRGAGSKVKPITPTTGRNIIGQRVKERLGEKAVGTITPHSFRHYFVTTVLRGSGGNLKLAQKLARHKNIAVTQRYAHLSDDELDRGYCEIFEE